MMELLPGRSGLSSYYRGHSGSRESGGGEIWDQKVLGWRILEKQVWEPEAAVSSCIPIGQQLRARSWWRHQADIQVSSPWVQNCDLYHHMFQVVHLVVWLLHTGCGGKADIQELASMDVPADKDQKERRLHQLLRARTMSFSYSIRADTYSGDIGKSRCLIKSHIHTQSVF